MNSTTRTRLNLRELINERGLKIRWLCAKTGISEYRMARLFQGAVMSLTEACALSRVLNVPVETFAEERDE